ncbi:hypothetical protein F8M49_21110 [Rhodococcus zopfii]|uniref:Uncharacterized protein n=1 Tax=Rhodococcus zopfii TaxID=43772 RepID=A0ABU3WMY6_9NOCA|nr:hypothetical protein [Rhodococcus zopfii]MDV2477221.1 hypothetical protein [Rhodococcus zopfii]
MTDIDGGYDPTLDDEPCFGADQDCDCGNCAVTTDRTEIDRLAMAVQRSMGRRALNTVGIAADLIEDGWRKPREITTVEELDALHVDTLIVASGTYLRGKGEFYDCWAIPVPNYISGTTERTWWVMVHGDDWASSLTTTSRITEARVLYTPEEPR